MRFAALIALFTITSATELSPVDNVRAKFYLLERDLWKNVVDPAWRDSGLGGDVELTKAFVGLDDEIQAVPYAPQPQLSSWIWSTALEKMHIINGLYKSFVEFARRQATPGAVPAPTRDWLDMAEAILKDPRSSVRYAMKKLDDLLAHLDRALFFSAKEDEASETCTAAMSPHQLIFDIYNTVALTEIKGYAMMQFSWMLLRIYGKGNFTQEASLTRQRYSQRTAQAAAVAKSALSEASRDLYMCDPPMHIEGSTYEQVTRLLQGYVENEVDMNTDGTCKENCAHYTLAEKHGCYMDQFCAKQTPCRGRIIDCQYLDSDMWVCPASRNSNRRYEWIEYENGRKLGNVGSCSRGTTKVDSWWRWNLLHCSYCFCLCEDDVNSSERFFSMKEATADISNNKVVTGLRLLKIGRVFHLQVHEGTLKERGTVEPSGWVPVNKFDPNDPGMMDGIDYHTLTYEKRAIDLDELDSPEGHVLTGVRFRVIGAHLHFEIRSTPFNYTTGRLSPSKSQWVSNDNTEGSDTPRSKLELKTPDLPTRSHTRMEVDSNHDQYVEFTHSDFDADAAQSTVPFIDVQPVLPSKGAALATGAGVIHRGAPSSGGFIALKLRSYNNARHVKAEPPPADFTEEKDDAADFVLPVVNN
ncbi:uncharacterized protein LOC115442913 isoform X3 [Manduca sexta]|uniref:uncharacterized protein LOC115442913 isoform X3 n=1 Tax=Manduca sexta TaxID=7130 RepID=UPI0018900A5C|nr:uncharacterized protein LOC115442913 isoform X3 [Manduca sexta]